MGMGFYVDMGILKVFLMASIRIRMLGGHGHGLLGGHGHLDSIFKCFNQDWDVGWAWIWAFGWKWAS
jgi:hypothetical protein